MALQPFATNDEVRATLGVSDEELSDETLDLEVYARVLSYELAQIGASLEADFRTAEEAGDSRTAPQKALYEAVRLFAPFALGNQLATSLPLAAPKSVTDGKAGISRFSESPFQLVAEQVRGEYTKYRDNLKGVYAEFSGGSSATYVLPAYFGVAAGSFDPVTGA